MNRFLISLSAMLSMARAADTTCIEPSKSASRCVVVGPVPLAHTGQFMGAGDTLNGQIKNALANVDRSLKSGGSSLAQAVKLNFYVTDDSATFEIHEALALFFSGSHKPAVSFVTTTLPKRDALVAIDAVGVAADAPTSNETFSVMPVGPRVYISGQAVKGDGSLSDATRQTLAELKKTLDFLGLNKNDVVQVKSFLTPMERVSEVQQQISAFFGDAKMPPCIFTEWQSPSPIEIELIVSARSNNALAQGPSVEVRTPPGMTASPVFSRLTIARHPHTIYTSGLYPKDGTASPESQLRSLFTNLKQCLDLCGSDWTHLVKATYYVSNEDLNKWHNTLRPDYFSPRRPPAASKATVAGVGRAGHGIMMDFIVVPGD